VSAPEPFAEASRSLLRERILGAAAALVEERRWGQVTMAEVAASAGVSRQTIYNEFGSRHELAQALLLRAADLLLDVVEAPIAAAEGDAVSALEGAFAGFLAAAERDPLARAIASGGGDDLLPLITTEGGPLLHRATDRLGEALTSTWPQLPREHAQLVAEGLVRLAISHLALPTERADVAAAQVARMFGPYLEDLLVAGRRAA
jgi:AcrR family transcriptional regulator